MDFRFSCGNEVALIPIPVLNPRLEPPKITLTETNDIVA